MQIVGCHESTGASEYASAYDKSTADMKASSDTWNEQVKLDGKETKALNVKAHVSEILLLNIPAGYYAGGQADNP